MACPCGRNYVEAMRAMEFRRWKTTLMRIACGAALFLLTNAFAGNRTCCYVTRAACPQRGRWHIATSKRVTVPVMMQAARVPPSEEPEISSAASEASIRKQSAPLPPGREPGSFANIGSFQIRRPLAAIPFLILAVVADLGGAMRFLLSLNPELARKYRLDGVYGVAPSAREAGSCGLQSAACRKRYYGGRPYLCTFSYPGDWSLDPSVEFARFQQEQQLQQQVMSLKNKPGVTPRPLPLVAVGPSQGAGTDGLSVSLYTRATRAATLAEALGSPEKALIDLMSRFTEQAPKLRGRSPTSKMLAAEEASSGGAIPQTTYYLESQVRYPGDTDQEALSVWTTAMFVPGDGIGGYVLLLTGVAPLSTAPEMRDVVRAASRSLERLPDNDQPSSATRPG